MRYRVSYLLEVDPAAKPFGLNSFTQDAPSTKYNMSKREARHAEENNYEVISCTTAPEDHYMNTSIARARHTREGTENEERVAYLFPVDCAGWLATLLGRQGYAAVPDGEVMRIVTTGEAEALDLAALDEEIAAAGGADG